MQEKALKENRRHGDILLPISNYRIEIENSKVVLDCHWHEELEFFKVIQGSFRFQIASRYYDAAEGDLLFVNRGELHSAMAEQNGNFAFQAIVFSPDMLKGPSEDKVQLEYLTPLLKGNLPVQRCFHQTAQAERKLQDCFTRIYSLLEERPAAYEILLKAYLYFLLNELVQTGSSGWKVSVRETAAAESIKKAIGFMRENYRNPVTIEALAQLCSVSPGHFCRTFKKYTMKTPVEYLNCYRLSKAAEMLETTDRKILDIALDCGFNSLSYFVNVFHEAMGCAPSQYRKRQ